MRKVILDLEVYSNYFLIGWYDFKNYYAYTEVHLEHIKKLLAREPIYFITFNGLHYDLRILSFALNRFTSPTLLQELKCFSDFIINKEIVDKRLWPLFEPYKFWNLPSLDLKQVLGGRICPSLKKIACRLKLPEVEALPIDPAKVLTPEEKKQIQIYNKLDVKNTKSLLEHCQPLLDLRASLTKMFKVDCISLGDAQIAERIIGSKIQTKPESFSAYPRPLAAYVPKFNFETLQLQKFQVYLRGLWLDFERIWHREKGKLTFKKYFLNHANTRLSELELNDIIPNCEFKFGGLHSVHKTTICGERAWDVDVSSFYPNLILNYKIFPSNLGEKFIQVYQEILDKRLQAKKEGNKVESESLKIVLNSTFGKFNEYYSKLHDPLCGAQVCLTGELAILRLMDLCYQDGVDILMVNTDGIVTKQNPAHAIKLWEEELNMNLEVKEIKKYIIKDSNNHLLRYADGSVRYADGSVKIKGIAFAYESNVRQQSNFPIINRSICEYLLNDIPIEQTITNCTDIHQFLAVYAKGPSILELKAAPSASEAGVGMPALVRFYVGNTGLSLFRRNAKTWTRIADSENFVLCNKIPLDFPLHLAYDAYVAKAKLKLKKLGLREC